MHVSVHPLEFEYKRGIEITDNMASVATGGFEMQGNLAQDWLQTTPNPPPNPEPTPIDPRK
jgi:hypothetical protein